MEADNQVFEKRMTQAQDLIDEVKTVSMFKERLLKQDQVLETVQESLSKAKSR